jgi:hypothetical protein
MRFTTHFQGSRAFARIASMQDARMRSRIRLLGLGSGGMAALVAATAVLAASSTSFAVRQGQTHSALTTYASLPADER